MDVRLRAALLLAATINGDGNIELPERSRDGRMRTAVYGLDGEGNVRRCNNVGPADFDMMAFSASVSLLFGENTPELFRLESALGGSLHRHTLSDEVSDRRREQTIRDAFNVYLLAYEERLV